ncbi:MAG: ThiF family adenylyltransferase [Verrucomicrobiales bacterium]|nr:ThiF family adenylyltransferase [Verrucomicrobiales bacterium]
MNTLTASPEWCPRRLDPRNPADQQTLAGLVAEGKVRETFDTILEQLRELVALRHPKRKLTHDEFSDAVAKLLGGAPLRDYGRWIFYPWSGRLVHLLEREEFREVRLNRNRNKISAVEQARLGEITVGVVGLSVGSAVARTLALEGIGTLKLADFDCLDLSNLNRIQAGVADLGVNTRPLTKSALGTRG